MYNLIYTQKEYRIGDMFDRFGKNSLYQRDVFEYNLVSISDIEPNQDKNIIIGDDLHHLIKNSKKIRKLMSKKNFVIVSPFEHEALHDLWFNHFVKNIHSNLFPQRQVYMVSYDVNSKETFEQWKKEKNVQSEIQSIHLDTFLFQNLDVFFENEEIVHREHFESKHIKPFRYVCYNGDPKQHRVDFVEKLQEEKLDKFGLISLLRKDKPLILDREKIDHSDMRTQRYPISHYRDTYFSVVTESYFWAGHGEHYKYITGISEKTYKALLLNPFIILGGRHTLKHLKKLGFVTFPELFDESYDEIFDTEERKMKVFDCVKRACKIDEQDLNNLYHDKLVDKVKHNQNLYMEYDRKKLFDKFLEQIDWNYES